MKIFFKGKKLKLSRSTRHTTGSARRRKLIKKRTAPAWLNAANEEAVAAFLLGQLSWSGISEVIYETLQQWTGENVDSIETILKAGDFTQVKPGLVHQFEGLEDGVAFELYWAEFNHNDIKRETVGHASS